MNKKLAVQVSGAVVTMLSMSTMFGCANYEVNSKRGNIPGHYIRQEMQESDRAVEAARQAGKDKTCPAEFKAAEDAKDHAYDVFRACHTEEGAALAKEATAKAQALCPPQPVAKEVVQPAELVQPSAAPAEVVLVPVPVTEPTPEMMKYCVFLDIEYDINSAEIRPQYQDQVAKVGEFMKKNPTTTALIEGYADEVGPAGYNLQLSQQRAEKVVQSLVDNYGIDKSRLSAKGYGEAKPVSSNVSEVGKQQNRRIAAIIDCVLDVKELAAPPERLCVSLKLEFATGSATIDKRYHDEISKVGDYMKKYPTTSAVIEGHTDNSGDAEQNMKLSQQRAETVVNYLAEQFGIERSRLSAKGYGSSRSIAYNTTPEGRQQNRRINAIIDCVISK
jgi:OOP family OmpA-OmpF porin